MIGGVLYIVLLWKWHVSCLPYCLPHSLLPHSHPPPPHLQLCLAHSLSSSLPPSLLASLSYLFYSLPHSPWLSYITLCLTDSPVSHTLPHSLPHSLSHSLPCIALPYPIPSHFPASLIHFSSLSHCLTFPSLTFLPYSLPQSLPCLFNSLFLHSVIASLTPPNSFLPYSLPQSLPAFLTPCLTYCLFYSTFIHSLIRWLPYITLCLTYSTSFTPLPHSLSHSLSHSLPCITLCCTQSLLTPLRPSFTFSSLSHCLTLPSLTHSCHFTLSITPCLTHSLPHSPCLIHSAVSPCTINSLVCLLLASFTP